jgi:hypothetical protein
MQPAYAKYLGRVSLDFLECWNAPLLLEREVLQQANIKHGIFGGYAVASFGGPRESKDADCIAAVSKE